MKLEEFEALAKPEDFRAFTVCTKGGLKARSPALSNSFRFRPVKLAKASVWGLA
jgi:hypothetical protein